MLPGSLFLYYEAHRARRGIRGNLSGEYERKTPFAILEMRSGNGITKSKRPYLRNLPDTRATPFVLVWKNKQKIAVYIRHQLDEEKPGDRIAMLGKDNAPFQGGKQEQGASFTNGK